MLPARRRPVTRPPIRARIYWLVTIRDKVNSMVQEMPNPIRARASL